MKRYIAIVVVLVLALAGCTLQPTRDDGVLQVVTTVGMLQDMVQRIGGEYVEAEALMGPGVDPHLYQASTGDISLLENAEAIIYVGLHLEGKMNEILAAMAEKKTVAAVGEAVPLERRLKVSEDTYDPHIWFDVELWMLVAGEVTRVLSEADPVHAVIFEANADVYLQELAATHELVKRRAGEIPSEKRVIITAHDAFSYFGRAYGFEVRGVQGISTASEYGLQDLEDLIDFIVERKIKAIFVESSVSKKAVQALKEGVNARGWQVEIGGELFSDAMGAPGTPEGVYTGMVQHNINTIADALQ